MECTISTSSTVKWLPPLVLAVHITIDVLYCTVSQKLNGEEIKPELEATAPNIIFFPRERKKQKKTHAFNKYRMMRNKINVALNTQYNIQ